MKGLYCVKAKLISKVENRVIWQFNSIIGFDKQDAIDHCKYTMESIMGTIPDYLVWSADSEWENNLSVN